MAAPAEVHPQILALSEPPRGRPWNGRVRPSVWFKVSILMHDLKLMRTYKHLNGPIVAASVG